MRGPKENIILRGLDLTPLHRDHTQRFVVRIIIRPSPILSFLNVIKFRRYVAHSINIFTIFMYTVYIQFQTEEIKFCINYIHIYVLECKFHKQILN